LGAGTAGLMAYHLKQKHPEMNMKAYLYGCPPILDLEAAVQCRDIFNSFINRDDIIPRLTMGSLYDLKAMIKVCLEDNPQFTQKIWQVISAGGNMPKTVSEKMGPSGIDIHKIKSLKSEEKLFPPGRVIYLFNPKEKTSKDWYGELSDNIVFDEIVLSAHMYTDHMPNAYERNLTKAYKTHQNEAHELYILKPNSEISAQGEGGPLGVLENLLEAQVGVLVVPEVGEKEDLMEAQNGVQEIVVQEIVVVQANT